MTNISRFAVYSGLQFSSIKLGADRLSTKQNMGQDSKPNRTIVGFFAHYPAPRIDNSHISVKMPSGEGQKTSRVISEMLNELNVYEPEVVTSDSNAVFVKKQQYMQKSKN